MGEATKTGPENQSVVPHLVIRGAAKALDFYAEAFGAESLCKIPAPDGRLMHGSMTIGNSWVYVCDEFPEHCPDKSTASPQALGGTSVQLHLNVADADASFAKAVTAGATGAMPPADMFWGARYAQVVDPFGHRWSMAHPLPNAPTMEELQKRAAGAMAEPQPA